MLRVDDYEERFWKRVASPHPVEQPSGTDLRAHARSEIGDQQGESDNAKHRLPGAGGNMNESRVDVRKGLRCRPEQLRGIDLYGRQNPDTDPSQNGCPHNIS